MSLPRAIRTAKQPPAVVVGLDSLTGLQTVRALATHDVPVLALAKQASHYCCWTRLCDKPLITNTDGPELIECLSAAGRELPDKAVLIPCTDLSVLQISRHRDRLAPWFHVNLPSHDVVNRLLDKARFIEFAQEHNLAIPPSMILRNERDAQLAAQQLRFPCVLKPAVKTAAWQTHVGEKAFVADDKQQLLAKYRQWRGPADELVVQQWIGGPLTNQFTCNCYFDSASQPLVTFVTRKLRQWPPTTGIACLSEEYQHDEVETETIRLFQKAGFRGLAYLEMKQDPEDGRCYIVEPNIGRPTGRANAAEAGGVELMLTAYCDAIGRPLPEKRSQQFTDIKWVHRRRDLQAAWRLWRRGELSFRGWRETTAGRKVDALFQWNDWMPFFGDLLHVSKKPGKRLTARKPTLAQGAESEPVRST